MKERIESVKVDLLSSALPTKVSNVETEWVYETMKFSFKAGEGLLSSRITGTIDITEDKAIVQSNLPILAKPFEGIAIKAINDKWNKYFA